MTVVRFYGSTVLQHCTATHGPLPHTYVGFQFMLDRISNLSYLPGVIGARVIANLFRH